MTATVRCRTGWDRLHFLWALVSARCDPTRNPLRRARRSDRAACRRNHSAGPPLSAARTREHRLGWSWNITDRDVGLYMADAQKMISEKLPRWKVESLIVRAGWGPRSASSCFFVWTTATRFKAAVRMKTDQDLRL